MEGDKERKQEPVDVSLKELNEKLAEFTRERGWEKFHNPRNLLLAMVWIPSHVEVTKDHLLFPSALDFHSRRNQDASSVLVPRSNHQILRFCGMIRSSQL